ncbi:MAG: hypothetical protein ACYS8X_06175 [Planctomycetota bacterium]|jgi:hypothetical protein
MMTQLSEHDYELIGRWLDGEPVELTDAQRAAADEIAQDANALDLSVDARRQHQAMDRARRRLSAELARPTRRRRLSIVASVEAVAVAAVLIFTIIVGTGVDADSIWPLEAIIAAADEADAPDVMDLIQDEMDALQAELLVELPDEGHEELELDDLQREIDEFWLDEPADILFEES